MPGRRLINGALDGFLGHLVSRNSHYNGFWLIGFLAVDGSSLKIDLLRGGRRIVYSPEDHLVNLALRKFNDQLGKWRIPPSWVAEARLDVIWSTDVVSGFVGRDKRDGYEATFSGSVRTDLGRTLARAKHVFAVPHNPSSEMPSAKHA